ncbi:hypothetical protein [Nocardia miyunensis]|uniref:hypothetical protein n=1 Tax=Nocardia miyunensis TaxID=282684 RepID=UPI0008333CC0|nr:hypothetical protein [Nocardia miyunensis]
MKSLPHLGAVATMAAAVAICVASGTAHADTAAPQQDTDAVGVQVAPGVQFTGASSDNSAQLVTPFGTVTTGGGRVAVSDNARRPILGTPLSTAANVATPAATAIAPVAPVAGGDPLADLGQAWHQAGPYTALGATVGGTAGGLAGLVIGCPLGAATLGSLATLASAATLTVPGMIGGCVAGAATTAATGGMLGAAAVGLPVGAVVTIQKYNQIQAQRAAASVAPH